MTIFVFVLQTWQLYERNELVMLVDTSLDGDFDAEQACRYLKIGLLCTQDALKLRPSMSTILKMLNGEMEVNDNKITKPGLISDFMDLKIKSSAPEQINAAYDYVLSDNTTLPSTSSSQGNSTFTTSAYDQSI